MPYSDEFTENELAVIRRLMTSVGGVSDGVLIFALSIIDGELRRRMRLRAAAEDSQVAAAERVLSEAQGRKAA